MSYLIAIDPKENVILRPSCVKLCPELSVLSEKELLVIILAFDYHSIYKRYNEADRIRRAIIHVFGDNEPKLLDALEKRPPHDRITVAVEAYKSLQYDNKEELIIAYQRKIDSLTSSLDGETGPTAIKNILNSISELRKNKLALETEVANEVIEQGKIKGDQELSYVEEMQASKKRYELVTRKKAA